MIGLDVKIRRVDKVKYVSYLIFATSNEMIVVDVHAILRVPHCSYNDWRALSSLLKDPQIIKVNDFKV